MCVIVLSQQLGEGSPQVINRSSNYVWMWVCALRYLHTVCGVCSCSFLLLSYKTVNEFHLQSNTSLYQIPSMPSKTPPTRKQMMKSISNEEKVIQASRRKDMECEGVKSCLSTSCPRFVFPHQLLVSEPLHHS